MVRWSMRYPFAPEPSWKALYSDPTASGRNTRTDALGWRRDTQLSISRRNWHPLSVDLDHERIAHSDEVVRHGWNERSVGSHDRQTNRLSVDLTGIDNASLAQDDRVAIRRPCER